MVRAYEPVTILREAKKIDLTARQTFRLGARLPDVKLSLRELRDMIIAILLFFFAFWRFKQPSVMTGNYSLNVLILASIGFGACLAFLLHELAHKFMASHLGSAAEFRLEPIGVAVTAISALAGLPVIVPGAVNLTRPVSDKEILGKVALVGPVTNVVLALLARSLGLNDLFLLNVVFALVNLLPVYILDGKKVFYWSKLVWLVAFLSAASLAISLF